MGDYSIFCMFLLDVPCIMLECMGVLRHLGEFPLFSLLFYRRLSYFFYLFIFIFHFLCAFFVGCFLYDEYFSCCFFPLFIGDYQVMSSLFYSSVLPLAVIRYLV